MVMKKGGKERQLLTTLECETHKQALIVIYPSISISLMCFYIHFLYNE